MQIFYIINDWRNGSKQMFSTLDMCEVVKGNLHQNQ